MIFRIPFKQWAAGVLFGRQPGEQLRIMEIISRYDEANAAMVEWAKLVKKKLAQRVGSLRLKDRRALQKLAWNKANIEEYRILERSIGSSYKKDFGQISRINFPFSRQGIFLEHGAGRRRPKGTNPKPWIVPTLDPAIDELADILVERFADIVAGEIKFSIPGIISRRVKIDARDTNL